MHILSRARTYTQTSISECKERKPNKPVARRLHYLNVRDDRTSNALSSSNTVRKCTRLWKYLVNTAAERRIRLVVFAVTIPLVYPHANSDNTLVIMRARQHADRIPLSRLIK